VKKLPEAHIIRVLIRLTHKIRSFSGRSKITARYNQSDISQVRKTVVHPSGSRARKLNPNTK